jgi:selenocysteine lyase/cysteine desulfurase/glycine/D-amino acid oxidase-like deaminating enzyme
VTTVDVSAERRRTPGTRFGHHLNAAGSSLPSEPTLQAVIGHLRLEADLGGYEAAAARREQLEAVYTDVAAILGGAPGEIALLDSATSAMQRVVTGLRLGTGDEVVTTPGTYVSVALHLFALQQLTGVKITVAPLNESGSLDRDALARLLTRDTVRLVIATHVPTSSGQVEPVREIGALAAAAGVPYIIDATQSVGQLPVDVRELRCSALVTTGRKFLRGPRGTGVLWLAGTFADQLTVTAPDIRGARWTGDRSWRLANGARRFESWEASHALRLGLGVAARELLTVGIDAVHAHTRALAAGLRSELARMPGVRVSDPPGEASAIVTFTVDGQLADEVTRQLAERRVHVWQVPASHAQWDLGARQLPAVVRAAVHVYNDADDVDALLRGVEALGRPARGPARPAPGPATRETIKPAVTSRARGHADVVVVGMGIHGASTVVALLRRGLRVAVLEQFAEGHRFGSSHGQTRMIRRAYPSPVWTPLIETAYQAWDQLADEVGQPLIEPRGGLFVRAPGQSAPLDGPGCSVLDDEGLARAGLSGRVAPGATVVHDPGAGVLDASTALHHLWQQARSGADLRLGERLAGWVPGRRGVEVVTTAGSLHAGHLVLCPGSWVGGLLPELAHWVRVQRILNLHVRVRGPAELPPGLPVFSVDTGSALVYGIPPAPGRLLKIGLDDGPGCDPDGPRPEPAEAETLLSAVAGLWGVDLEVDEQTRCLYTVAQDRRFLVGAVPGRDHVTLVSACSGHGFKFGPALGEAAADLVTGVPRPDLAFLDPARALYAAERGATA